jgi:uncharacterized protein (DUF1800 family)
MITGSAALASAAVLPSVMAAPAAAAGRSLSAADFLPTDPLTHLLRRATWGPTRQSLEEVRTLGSAAWLERQLKPSSIADDQCEALVGRLRLAALTTAQVSTRVAAGTLRQTTEIEYETGYAAIGRAVWSKRQLFEVMVDFWSNHLNVTCGTGETWDSRQDYDRKVIRAHTFGRFSEMLKASARHPAMLRYLDNSSSSKSAPNENYGRELLELHTVGTIYRETDVKDAARLLTGLIRNWENGAFRYMPSWHAVGPVTVLGFRHANATAAGGERAVMAMLDYLAMHPSTARRIVTKLCVRFVSDNPPAALVTRLAKIYLAGKTAVVPVLRALFNSVEFKQSIGQKTRTPLEDVVATVRVLGYGAERVHPATNPQGTAGMEALYWMSAGLGQAPMAWRPPNGYPDVASAWSGAGSTVQRWNMHLKVAAGWWPTQLQRPADPVADMIGAVPKTYGGLIDAVALRLLGRKMRVEHAAVLAEFFAKELSADVGEKDPAINGDFPYLVSLMLDSPYFALR